MTSSQTQRINRMSTVTPSAPTVQPTIKNWLAQNWLGLTLAILVTLALVACFVVIGYK